MPPDLQYAGKDCQALAVCLGVGMNLVPILSSKDDRKMSTSKHSKTTLSLSSLTKPHLAIIMVLLSDSGTRRVLEWVQSAGLFTDETRCRWAPGYPKSQEDLLALTEIRFDGCHLTGNKR